MFFEMTVKQLLNDFYFTLQCFEFVTCLHDVLATATAEERPAHRAWFFMSCFLYMWCWAMVRLGGVVFGHVMLRHDHVAHGDGHYYDQER
jgi:hypothetical protein